MVFTLHRYIFRELLRVFILATIGLTLIVSLGGILRPVQEYGIGPRQVVHIVVYFLPISLTFVLPVAALFAAALTYGRFAVDNELDACRASGISLLSLIYPGFVLAVLMAIANLLLSFHVMPYFVHLAEKSLKADAKQILFHNIQRQGYYILPPYLIYADYADSKDDALFGIIVVQFEGGRIKKIITSEVTKVQFDPHEKFNEVQLTVSKAKQIGEAANDFWGQVGSLLLRKEFGSLIDDEIKFKKIKEMKQIQSDLMRFDPVAKTARRAYLQLVTELLAGEMGKALSTPGSIYELAGESRCLRISARGCTLEQPLTIGLVAPVVVAEYDTRTSRLLRRLRSDKNAVLGMEEDGSPARWVLDLSNARVEETGQLVVRDFLGDLRLPASIVERLGPGGPLPVAMPDRTSALLGGAPSSILADFQRSLVREIHVARVHILSEINSRLIFGVGCIPMILIGISLGIIKREGHLLSAFGASCVPATVLSVAIISGKQVTERVDSLTMPGILLMWSGLAFLVVLAALIYSRLLRH
jgi:lipopolysaccharide export LptBFGC system permease protein LptF